MFNFMHESWHKAENGGLNYLYIQNPNHTFWQLDSTAIGLPETKWSMSIATADFNHDGFIDLYVANDFGADDLYYNSHGKHFQKIEGEMFGDISKDTYKGMNATVADFDENGFVDVHVSNVHHQLQAEGNLLWYFYPNPKDKNRPFIKDRATFSGALNENRFGWGAGVADFNNDGRVDLIQANGMVDNIIDRKKDQTEHDCPDYWYVNEKIARSSPDIHKYIDNWGDIRGKCIYGFEQNRLYINRGVESKPQFVDVADQVGMIDKANFRGMAVADFNNDGAMDFIASSLYRNPYVYKNHLGSRLQKNHWYGVTFISEVPNCNRQAIGSKVYIHTLDKNRHKKIQYFETTLVNGFSAQSDPRLHFALKEGHTFLKMHVLWCGKISQTYESLLPNQYQTLRLRR